MSGCAKRYRQKRCRRASRAVSPADLEIHGARAVPVRSPSLPTLVCAAEYRVHFPDGLPAGALAERVVALLTAEVLPLRQEKRRSAAQSKSASATRDLYCWS